MKTKKKSQTAISEMPSPAITNSTRAAIGNKISTQLDLMNDPRFKLDDFRAIEEAGPRRYTLSASNGEMFVSFTIEWKGGSAV